MTIANHQIAAYKQHGYAQYDALQAKMTSAYASVTSVIQEYDAQLADILTHVEYENTMKGIWPFERPDVEVLFKKINTFVELRSDLRDTESHLWNIADGDYI